MSFNYTPPPPEVIEEGKNAIHVLYILMLLAPKAKYGALVGGLGAMLIWGWVTSHAGGDIGGLSEIIEPPFYGAIGALVGAGASVVGQGALKLITLLLYGREQSQDINAESEGE